ncbi:sugar transferase [Nocardioides coralli]|uniref:sugar transferase n=1 Tax=Nocardioides coralli TaxID=2872154 RepID=UPI001CA3C47C|nr:sugar transferase [Nocardioides coralli]QZY28767.1 sugar transferase [Nocardioides coralli]
MTTTVASRVQLPAEPRYRALAALPATALLIDLGVVGISILVAAQLRRTGFLLDSETALNNLTVPGTVMAAGWVCLIAVRGGYDRDVFGAGFDEFKRVATASATAAAAIGIGCYMMKYQLSRGFFVFAFVVGIPMLLTGRYLLRKTLHRARRRGHLRRRILLVGHMGCVDDIARTLRREPWLGYEIVGALTPQTELDSETRVGVPVLGNVDEAVQLAPRLGAELVFFTGGGMSSAKEMRRTVWELERDNINVVVAPSVTDVSKERVQIRPVAGLPLIHVQGTRTLRASRWGKRSFDVLGSLGLIVMTLPALAVITLLIKKHDRGPVLFGHTRIGRDGEHFRCLKFRTMVPDADAQVDGLRRRLGRQALLFKDKEDPRITRPGKWLRRYSLDELPQLFNVLRGDMSLVGPRPQVAAEVAQYDEFMARRLHVRPGLTGLWQVSGRNDLDVDDSVRLDLYYVDNWSMMQDIIILMKTVRAVISAKGAY